MNQLAKAETKLHVLEPEKREVRAAQKQLTFSLSRSKLPALIIILLLVYLAVVFSSQFSSIASMRREIGIMEREMVELKQRNEALRSDLRDVKSDAFIEKAAREQLGLIKAGETRVITGPASYDGMAQ